MLPSLSDLQWKLRKELRDQERKEMEKTKERVMQRVYYGSDICWGYTGSVCVCVCVCVHTCNRQEQSAFSIHTPIKPARLLAPTDTYSMCVCVLEWTWLRVSLVCVCVCSWCTMWAAIWGIMIIKADGLHINRAQEFLAMLGMKY